MKDRGIGSYLRTLDTREDLEDWFLSKNLEFIKKRRKARQEHLLGKAKGWVS